MSHRCYQPAVGETTAAARGTPSSQAGPDEDSGKELPTSPPLCFGNDCNPACIVHNVWGLAITDTTDCKGNTV